MKKMLMVLGVASSVLLAGCATTNGTAEAPASAGFLSDY